MCKDGLRLLHKGSTYLHKGSTYFLIGFVETATLKIIPDLNVLAQRAHMIYQYGQSRVEALVKLLQFGLHPYRIAP